MQHNGKKKAPRAAATATERKEIKATYRIKQKPCAVKRRRRGNGGINDGYKLAVDDAGDRVPVSGARDLYGPAARPCAGEEGAAVSIENMPRTVHIPTPPKPSAKRPSNRWVPSQLAKLLGLYAAGVRDYAVLADAVGTTEKRVQHKIENLIRKGDLPHRRRSNAAPLVFTASMSKTNLNAQSPALDVSAALAELENLLTCVVAIAHALRMLAEKGGGA